jgi:hypothetical protein
MNWLGSAITKAYSRFNYTNYKGQNDNTSGIVNLAFFLPLFIFLGIKTS